jgi:RNA polymerase sigma factor (sigma-70 family)
MSYSTTTTPSTATLFHQAQAGDAASLDHLMQQHDGLVRHIIRQQWSGPLTYAETLQEGRIGLWRAIRGFDPARGTAFSTYASVAIARQVWRAVAQATPARITLLPDDTRTPSPEPLRYVLTQEVQTALQELVAQLPPRQREIVQAYYGLAGQEPHTLAQVGQQRGCSRQAIHQHLQRALVHLRHPAYSATLRALLGRNRRADYLQALRPRRSRP